MINFWRSNLEEYISRIRKLGSNDSVNSSLFNSTIQQLQHNIDLLYRSQASSVYNWNVSELVFGNMLDYDQVGEKRFINGGKFDSLEKVVSFTPEVGSVSLEEFDTLNNKYWMRWDIPSAITDNIILKRNIVVPEALRKQNVLIGFKLLSFAGNSALTGERFEIYVNGAYAGTAETGIHEVNSNNEPKTIYGTYSLSGTETNIEVSLIRSTTNAQTLADYYVRVEAVFAGLHSLGNSSYSLNYPPAGSSFVGAGADINAFYDFENNSVRPIPSFLINGNQLEGDGNLTVNITQQEPNFRNEYFVGAQGSGNNLGTDQGNLMSMDDFMAIEAFSANTVTVHLEPYDNYGDLVFDKGNYRIVFDDLLKEWKMNSVSVDNNSSLMFDIVTHPDNTDITMTTIDVRGQSRFEIRGDGDKAITVTNNGVTVDENSVLDFEIGLFSTPIVNAGSFEVKDHSKAFIKLINETGLDNGDAINGFGFSIGNLLLDEYASAKFESDNATMRFHVGRDANKTIAMELLNHSHLVVRGFLQMSTSAIDKKFKGDLHSSFELYGPIQNDTGLTAFTDIHLELFSTLGTTIDPDTIAQELVESFVYEIDA